MDHFTQLVLRLGCMLITSISLACTSTAHTSGEIPLPAGKSLEFRILNRDFGMLFSHNASAALADLDADTDADATGFFSLRFIDTQRSPVSINFDNEDCDQFISYRVKIRREGGSEFKYFDNIIPLESDIDVHITQDDNGNPLLMINNLGIPLEIKQSFRKLVIDADGDYTLVYHGLKPFKNNKEK